MLLRMRDVAVIDLETPSESRRFSKVVQARRPRFDYERVTEINMFGELSMVRVSVVTNTAISGMNVFGRWSGKTWLV
jgi:hypothetical protein